MSSSDAREIFDNFQEGVFNIFGGGEPMGTGAKIAIAVVIAFVIFVIIIGIYMIYKSMTASTFGNGRVVGSGCGRYNQLQRAVNLEFPISQTEYENHEMAKQDAAGIQYASQWQPQMENVYSGFQDRTTGVEIQHYHEKPQYPQIGLTQSVYNDNVFKNIAYD
jgi:hypothetical protein